MTPKTLGSYQTPRLEAEAWRHQLTEQHLAAMKKCRVWTDWYSMLCDQNERCRHRGWPLHFVGDRTSGCLGEGWGGVFED